MLFKLINLFCFGLTTAMIVVMLIFFRRERRVGVVGLLLSLFFSALILPVFIGLSGARLNWGLGLLLLMGGLLVCHRRRAGRGAAVAPAWAVRGRNPRAGDPALFPGAAGDGPEFNAVLAGLDCFVAHQPVVGYLWFGVVGGGGIDAVICQHRHASGHTGEYFGEAAVDAPSAGWGRGVGVAGTIRKRLVKQSRF